jgi:hypothetical protein
VVREEGPPQDGRRRDEVVEKALADVRKPIVTKSDSSDDVNVVPGIDVDAGLASMVDIYFASYVEY